MPFSTRKYTLFLTFFDSALTFILDSGMGAALLKTPDKLINILTSLVSQVGEPYKIPISVKIRLLETEEKTLELVGRLVKTGIKLLTIHCRTVPMRPREPSIRTSLKKVVDICHDANVYCYVNGDVEKHADLEYLIKTYGVDGAMIGRGAESNASCFNPNGMVPWHQITKEYMDLCKDFDNHVANTKYCLGRILPGKSPLYQKVAQSKTFDQIKEILNNIDEQTIKNYNYYFKSPLTLLEEQKQREQENKELTSLKRKLEFEEEKPKKKLQVEDAPSIETKSQPSSLVA